MKFWKKIFLTLGLSGALFLNFSAQAEAKIVTDKLPLLTYAETPIAVYDKPGGKRTGTISVGNSLVLVKIIRDDGWAYGSYKVEGNKKRPYRWFKMEELQGYGDFENYTDKVASDQNAYRTRSSSSYVGRVASDEDLIVVAKRGDRLKVIFKADGNFYRMGWLDKFSLSKTSSESTDGNEIYSDELLVNDATEENSTLENFDDENGLSELIEAEE